MKLIILLIGVLVATESPKVIHHRQVCQSETCICQAKKKPQGSSMTCKKKDYCYESESKVICGPGLTPNLLTDKKSNPQCKSEYCLCQSFGKTVMRADVGETWYLGNEQTMIPSVCRNDDRCVLSLGSQPICVSQINGDQICLNKMGCRCESANPDDYRANDVSKGFSCNEKKTLLVPGITATSVCNSDRCICEASLLTDSGFELTEYQSLILDKHLCEQIKVGSEFARIDNEYEMGDIITTPKGICDTSKAGVYLQPGRAPTLCSKGDICAATFAGPTCKPLTTLITKGEDAAVKVKLGAFTFALEFEGSEVPKLDSLSQEQLENVKVHFDLCAQGETRTNRGHAASASGTDSSEPRTFCKGSPLPLIIPADTICPNIGEGGCLIKLTEGKEKTEVFCGTGQKLDSKDKVCKDVWKRWETQNKASCEANDLLVYENKWCSRKSNTGTPSQIETGRKLDIIRAYSMVYKELQKFEYGTKPTTPRLQGRRLRI